MMYLPALSPTPLSVLRRVVRWCSASVFAAIVAAIGVASTAVAMAQTAAATPAGATRPTTALQWMQRWQQASATHAYAGTLALSGERGNLRSARLWHAARNGRQIERVDNLAGPPRSLYRTDQGMVVFNHPQQIVRIQNNMPRFVTLFPGLAPLQGSQQAEALKYYQVQDLGQERAANQVADVTGFVPADGLRHAYRFWSEQQTGVLLKWQLLELPAGSKRLQDARMLREVAFSDVQIPAPITYVSLEQMMGDTKGYAVDRRDLKPVTLQQQGWGWRQPLPGYFVSHCYLRPHLGRDGPGSEGAGPDAERRRSPGHEAGKPPLSSAPDARDGPPHAANVTQCLMTDGLSGISLFMEPADKSSMHGPGPRMRDATRILSRSYGNYRATVVGEVPAAMLQQVLDSLYRIKG